LAQDIGMETSLILTKKSATRFHILHRHTSCLQTLPIYVTSRILSHNANWYTSRSITINVACQTL